MEFTYLFTVLFATNYWRSFPKSWKWKKISENLNTSGEFWCLPGREIEKDLNVPTVQRPTSIFQGGVWKFVLFVYLNQPLIRRINGVSTHLHSCIQYEFIMVELTVNYYTVSLTKATKNYTNAFNEGCGSIYCFCQIDWDTKLVNLLKSRRLRIKRFSASYSVALSTLACMGPNTW